MYAKINGEEIPPDTLSYVMLSVGGSVRIDGEAINEQDRQTLTTILGGVNEGDAVEFDVETKDFKRFHGAGEIKSLNTEERGVGGLMRIKYIIGIQYVQ